MRKVVTYSCLGLAAILVVIIFITSTSYIQLALGVILYPVVAYFAVKVLRKRPPKPVKVVRVEKKTESHESHDEKVDDEKRTFLKLVGTTGIFFFVTSLLGNRVGNLLIGQSNLNSSLTGGIQETPPNASANPSGSLTASGYNISEIDEGASTYYGFTNKSGGWLIMKQDSDTSSFRYAKGDANFPAGWGKRQDLKYDYYYNLF